MLCPQPLLLVALLALALLAPAVPAAARDIYVDNAVGNDAFPGNAPAPHELGYGPCRTITRALQIMQKGDVIIIANTGIPYHECITMQGGHNSGFYGSPATIIGNGAVLDGSTRVPYEDWEYVAGDVFRYLPPRQTYQQLFLEGVPTDRVELSPEPPHIPQLDPLQYCQHEGYLYFRVEEGHLPANYDLSYSDREVGITLYDARRVVIQDLVIQGFRLDGVNAHDNTEAVLLGLTCRGNGRSGISVGGSSQVVIDDCLVGNNGAAQVRAEGYCTLEITNSDLLENTAPPLAVEGDGVTLAGDAADLAQ